MQAIPGVLWIFTEIVFLGAPFENREAIHRDCTVAFSGATRFKRGRERHSSKIGTP
jgi:hypothetical protein